MKEGWEYKKLEECCDVNYGTRVVRSKVSGSEFPVYGGGGETFRINCYNRENCLVVARFAMSKQCTRYVNGKFFLNDSGLTVSPKIDSCLTKELLEKYLLANNDLIYSFGRGSAQRNLNMSEFRSMLISFPIDNDEQRRIVSYLDSSFKLIDEIKEKAQKSLSEAKALFQSALAEAMEPKEGWKENTLKNLCEIFGNYGLSVPSIPFNGIRYLRITDITEWGELNNDKVSADIDICKQEILKDGDILFARTGATVGKTLMYDSIFGECLFAGYLIRYRVKKNIILPKYLFYVTHSKKYYEWINENQKAAAQPNISAKLYNNYTINYPTIEIQKKIVARLDKLFLIVKQMEERYKKMVEECDALKQAMLRDVFE